MRDYITMVNDTPVFREALLAEIAKGSKHCYLANDGAKLIACKVPIIGIGVKSVGVCRLSDEQIEWFLSLPETKMLGQAKASNIVCYGDVEWADDTSEAEYYSVYDCSPVTTVDDGGVEHTYIPPLIQGVLASADMGKLYKFISYDDYNASTEVDGEIIYTNAYKLEQPNARVSPDKTDVLVKAKGDGCVSIGTANKHIEDNWGVE